MATFRTMNLLEPFSFPQPFDIIFCRNVLIYFDQETKVRTFERVSRMLEPDGTLMLGAAETVVGISDAFKPYPDRRGLYQLNPARAVRAAAAGALPHGLRVVAAR